jgi:Fe-S cluster assembly protein SufD
MPVKEPLQSSRFCTSLKRICDQIKGADLLKSLRERAWDHFLELGLPEKKQEAFQYVPLRQLYEKNFRLVPDSSIATKDFHHLIYPECQHSYLVFVNGYFRADLSDTTGLPKQVVVLSMVEAMRSYGTFLQNRWGKTLGEEIDPFAILNLALHPQGLFVYVPPKVVVKTPIQCLYLGQEDQLLSMPRVQIFAASQSQVDWISRTSASGWVNEVLDVALEEDAQLRHLSVSDKESGWHLSSLRATQKRCSRLRSWNVVNGGDLSRHSYRTQLMGEGAEADLSGLWMLKENHQAHTHVVVEHQAPHCRSLQKFKGVLAEISQSSFEGKILVHQAAQKTEAYQLNNNLLLGDHAIANSKPNLEIFADDVKASHGATCTQVDEEALFYLKSRGISTEQAKRLLVQGFCREILDLLPFPSVRNEYLSYVQNRPL